MGQTPRLTLSYLHHAHAVGAVEQLEAIELRAFTHLKPAERQQIVARLERAAAGRPPESAAEARARKEARWDAAWASARGIFGSRSRERVIVPRE